MSRPVIVVGDRTSHGGVVITGSPFSDVDGKGIARIGDKVTCPQKGHGVNVIVTGDITNNIDGSPVARHGDKTACGATLISSQVLAYVDNGSSVGNSSTSNSFTPYAAAGSSSVASDDLQHEIQFQALDAETGMPVPHSPYVVTREDGTEIEGITDRRGITEIITASSPERVGIHFFFKSPVGDVIGREDLA